jgi:hypothetical protein
MNILFVGGPWDGVVKEFEHPLAQELKVHDTKDRVNPVFHKYRLMQGTKKPVLLYIHENISPEAAYFELIYDINLRRKVKQLIEELT